MDLTWLWRIIVGAAVSVSIGLGGWTLSAVANMPKEYILKDDFKDLRKENREDHKQILEQIRKLHKGEWYVTIIGSIGSYYRKSSR